MLDLVEKVKERLTGVAVKLSQLFRSVYRVVYGVTMSARFEVRYEGAYGLYERRMARV